MKKFLSVIIAVTVACSFAACGAQTTQPTTQTPQTPAAETPAAPTDSESTAKTVIKMATGGQDTLPSYAATLDVIKDIETADSNIKIEYYGARQLGDDAEILQQVMAGTIQMGGTAYSAFSTYTSLLEALTIPFLLNDYEKERAAMDTPEVQAIFDRIEADLGIKVLVSYDSGMRHFANNIKPITSIEDLKGLKMRVVPSDLLINSFKAMGANPTSMAYGEIYTGLQNKIIDGEDINITSIYTEKHYEVLNYFTEIGIYPFATIIFANADWFNSLDVTTQQEITDGFKNGYNYVFDKYLAETEKAGYEAMEKAGVEITKIDDITPFKDAVKDVTEEYRQKDQLISDFIDMANNLK